MDFPDDYRPFNYRRMVHQPTGHQQEDRLLSHCAIAKALQDAPEQLRELADLIGQQYRESEIADMMGISRQKVWRLRQHLRKLLESLNGDWGTG